MAKELHVGNDRGGVTVGGAQVVAAANTYRRGMTFQNTSDVDMWLRESGGAASVGSGYKIAPGIPCNVSTSNLISVYCASAGKTFAATEY